MLNMSRLWRHCISSVWRKNKNKFSSFMEQREAEGGEREEGRSMDARTAGCYCGGNRVSIEGVDGARGRQQGDWVLNVARKRQQDERMLNGARGLLASERSLLNFPLPRNIFCRKESCALSDARL